MSKYIPIVLVFSIISSSIVYYRLTQFYAKRMPTRGLAEWQETERRSNVQKNGGAGSFRPIAAIREDERQTGNGVQSKNRTITFPYGKVNLI